MVSLNCGIDCSCEQCKKIRLMLKNKEKSGEIYLSGSEENKRKIRSETDE